MSKYHYLNNFFPIFTIERKKTDWHHIYMVSFFITFLHIYFYLNLIIKPLNHNLANNDLFPHCASWQSMAEVNILIKRNGHSSNGLIGKCPTVILSRRDSSEERHLIILERSQKQPGGGHSGPTQGVRPKLGSFQS